MKLVNYVHKCQQLYTKYKAIPENIVSLLPSGLLRVRSIWQQTSDNFSGIAWYCGDNDFIIRTFNFIACSDKAHVSCST